MVENLLEMRDITKDFFGVKAVSNVNIQLRSNEILAIVGENGAGKSTLMNILSGTYPHSDYSGSILFENEVCKFSSIRDSEKKGIVIIHQELALIPNMSIAENIFLGNERKNNGRINWNATQCDAEKYLNMVSLDDNPSTLIKDIGIGKQQLVEICKALAKEVRVLILDEPTAALNNTDSMFLLNMLFDLKQKGISSIIISHKLNEVCYVADRIAVIRDGCVIETLDKNIEPFSEERIIKSMVGREISERFPKRKGKIEELVFEVNNWSAFDPVYREKKIVDNVSITLHKGEVVGIYGLMGAGRTEFMMSVFGKSYGDQITGEVRKNGQVIDVSTVAGAIKNKIALIPEDRKGNGLNLIGDIKVNISMAALEKISKNTIVDNYRDIIVANEYCHMLGIRSTGVFQKVESLSGGNQQKVVLAKWIFTQPDVFLLDEPTRGVDVGAKYEIYSIINQMVERGAGAILISSELTEILGMCDRVYIFKSGRVVGEMETKTHLKKNIMQCIIGQTNTKED